MAGTATLYTQQAVLAHTLAYGTMTAPAGIFIGLCASSPPPTSTTGGTEVTGGAYARQAATFALSGTNPDVADNTATIEFPAATAVWGTIGYFELWDAVTTGNRLYWGPLVDPTDGVTPITRTIQPGDIVRFQAGVIWVQAT